MVFTPLTKHRVSQLPTDHTSITAVPGVMTYGTPDSTETNLYCSFSWMMTSQSDLTLSTVGWNCQHGQNEVISTDHFLKVLCCTLALPKHLTPASEVWRQL